MNLKSGLILTTLILFPFFNSYPLNSGLPNVNDTSDTVSARIETEKEELKRLSAKKNETENRIKNLTLEIRKKEKEVLKYKNEFTRLQDVAEKLKKQIAEKEVNMPEIKKNISEYLRMIYMREKIYPLKIIYTSKNYLDTAEVLNTIRIISLKEIDKFEKLKGKIDSLRDDKASLEQSLIDAKEVYNKARNSEKELLKKRKELSTSLFLTVKSSAESEEKIAQLEKEYEKKSKKKQTEGKGDKKNFTGIINKNTAEKEEFGDFIYNKGELMWPLKDSVLGAGNKDNTGNDNNGKFQGSISIHSFSSRAVQSVYSGTIIFSAPFLEFKNLVIVDHGSGYYSVYGFDGQTFVNKGQKVYTGKVLGKINLDREGYAKLYFEINLRGKSLDTLEWLKKIPL